MRVSHVGSTITIAGFSPADFAPAALSATAQQQVTSRIEVRGRQGPCVLQKVAARQFDGVAAKMGVRL
jgi:hypothetical protein